MNFCRGPEILSRETFEACRELVTLKSASLNFCRRLFSLSRDVFSLCWELGVFAGKCRAPPAKL
jgi:hypothetical protein